MLLALLPFWLKIDNKTTFVAPVQSFTMFVVSPSALGTFFRLAEATFRGPIYARGRSWAVLGERRYAMSAITKAPALEPTHVPATNNVCKTTNPDVSPPLVHFAQSTRAHQAHQGWA